MTLTISQSLRELPEYSQVLGNLIARDLKVKYQSKGLGFLWSLLHPAIYIGIWYLVFSLRVLNIALPDYWAFLLAGMLTYAFIQSAITEGAWAVRRNSGIIRKVYVPMEILVIAAVSVKTIEFVLQMAVAIVLLLIAHHGNPDAHFSLFRTLVVFPGAILLLYLFVLGVSMPLAGYAVIYRDLYHVVQLALTAFFYVTPVFWSTVKLVERHGLMVKETLLGRWGRVFALNPAMDLIELFRGPMYWGTWPDNPTIGGGAIATWGIAAAFSFAALIFGFLLLNRVKHILAEVV